MARFINHYECSPCDLSWTYVHSSTCNDKCPNCNIEMQPYQSDDFFDFYIRDHNIEIYINSDNTGGYIKSNFDEKRDKEDNLSPFSVAYDMLESMIVSCSCSGVLIDSYEFKSAIKTVADKILNEYGD